MSYELRNIHCDKHHTQLPNHQTTQLPNRQTTKPPPPKKMSSKKEETASFVLRFTQKIYKNETDESEVQWRGHIRHVQGDAEKYFKEFDEVIHFVQEKLSDLTMKAVEGKSPEEQKGILAKSFDLWKKVAADAPRLVMESIKDPRKQVANIQEQMHQVSDAIGQRIEDTIGQKLEIDEWRGVSKSDYKTMMYLLEKMSDEISALNQKVDALKK